MTDSESFKIYSTTDNCYVTIDLSAGGVISTLNSTSTPLLTGHSFTGMSEDVSAYPSVTVSCKSDQSGTLYVEFSPNGVNWDSSTSYLYTGGSGFTKRIPVVFKYYRVSFTNTSGTDQSYFRLQSIIGYQEIEQSSFETQPQSVVAASGNVIGKVLLGDSAQNDAFSRLRTSNPVTLFESSMEVDNQPLLWNEEIVGGGSATYNVNQSSVTLAVPVNTVSSVIRQSIYYCRYQPGKSLLVIFTFLMGSASSGITKRVGYFDSQNGVFLEQTESSLNWVIRTYTSGSVVDNQVSQANWNIDRMDGTGPSGITLDITKARIGIIDLEWLGVGRVRCGFFIGGMPYYCHYFTNTENTTVYMSRASLPVRYSISSNGTNGVNTLDQICSTVISEGGYIPRGFLQAIGNPVAKTVATTYTPVLAIRLSPTYRKGQLLPTGITVYSVTNDALNVIGLMRPTVTGGTWTSASTAVEYNTTMTGYTGGYVVANDYVTNKSTVNVSGIENQNLQLGTNIAGTVSDIFLVAIRSISGSSADAFTSVTWTVIY